MKIGVISDVHCNLQALKIALADLTASVEEIFVAGDVVYEYRFCAETVEMIRDRDLPYVLGNHEMGLLAPGGERAREGADDDCLRYIESRPSRIDRSLGGRTITMVHASPWAPYDRYLGPADPEWRRCAEMEADFLLTGHTHVPMVKTVAGTTIVNPGSLGESREPDARTSVSYAVVDLDSAEVEIRRIANPRLG